jgi:uncharacterized membrane protein
LAPERLKPIDEVSTVMGMSNSNNVVRSIASGALVAVTSAGLLLAGAAPSQAAATKYKNCAALNKVYPHGVGKKGARDKTSGTPVTNFTVSASVYAANKGSDRDGDGIACEKA